MFLLDECALPANTQFTGAWVAFHLTTVFLRNLRASILVLLSLDHLSAGILVASEGIEIATGTGIVLVKDLVVVVGTPLLADQIQVLPLDAPKPHPHSANLPSVEVVAVAEEGEGEGQETTNGRHLASPIPIPIRNLLLLRLPQRLLLDNLLILPKPLLLQTDSPRTAVLIKETGAA